MSWLFSRALVAAYSEATCLDGEPCAPSSGTPTPQAYSSHGKMTDFSRLSRFGMTYSPLTDDRGEAVLTSFLAAFPVRTSRRQAEALESQARDLGSGSTWRALSARFDLDSSSWKTAQCSSREDLPWSSVILPRWGMMRAGGCWARDTPEHHIDATESGLSLPTPSASHCETRPAKSWNPKSQSGRPLGCMAATNMWPTPRTTGLDGGSNSRKAAKARGMWPTPAARDYRHPNAKSYEERGGGKKGEQLPNAAGGPLNPTWVEWLMGWPLGWTDFAPLETAKFQQWRHSHGKR